MVQPMMLIHERIHDVIHNHVIDIAFLHYKHVGISCDLETIVQIPKDVDNTLVSYQEDNPKISQWSSQDKIPTKNRVAFASC